MGLEDDLDNKTNKELKEMVSELNKRVKNLESSKTKQSLTSTSGTDESSSEVSAFSLDPTKQLGNLKEQFNNAIEGFFSSANIFDDTVFKQLDEYSTRIQSSFGLSKARISEFRSTLAETAPELLKFGYDEADSVVLMEEAMKGLGTAASLSSKTIIQLGATSKVTGVDVGELAANFREVGISVQGVGKEMEDVTDYARSVGVSVKGVSEKVSDNLKQMNLFNFEGGVQGLAKMAATSERLGVSMNQVFELAEGLMSPEKAIDMSAALQRLGVTSGALLDPLRAMDLAQNDPEQLQKEMVNLSKEFTTFNEKTGKMEILPGAKRRLREVAKELGMNADEFAKMSIQASDFDRKLKQIRMPALAEGDEATKELIASMAQLDERGVATIQVKDVETGIVSEKKVEELTPDDIKNLQKANEESSKSIEEIAINQLDETKQINAYLQSGKIAGKMALATAPTVEKLGYFVSESTKSMARRYREGVGSVAGIREKQEGVAGPIEDYIYGFTQEDQTIMDKAKSDFLSGIGDVTQSFFDGTTGYVKNVFNDAISNVSSTFGRERQTSQPQTLTVNVKVEGDANTAKMDKEQITNTVIQGLQNPSTANAMSYVLDGGSSPSAATGRKN
jgi:hypothetical protein